jgi:hypothetical protein
MIHLFFEWAEGTWYGSTIRESTWGFAIFSVIHLLGLVLLLGGISMMSLRLFGVIMADRPVSEISRSVRHYTLAGLLIMLASGVTLWASEAVRMYDKMWFWWKMSFLAVGLVFHFSLFRKVSGRDENSAPMRLLTGVLALVIWFGVGFFGRAIGFL